jgi:hypothetical protein
MPPSQVAKEKLEKVDADANKQKSEIIRDLAKSLEGKVREDQIAAEIVHQLVDL